MNTEPHKNNSSELVAYISEARAVGLSTDHILTELLQAGWPDTDIKQAFAQLLRAPQPHLHSDQTKVSEPIIQVKGLTKKYGNFTAVDNISFDVKPGEIFGILGPNGAGKTTTLEMIEGLKQLSGGSIHVDGKDVMTQTQAVKSVIGVQLQASSFFESLSLKELLITFAALYNRTVDPMKLIADVQLTEKADNQVKELSGGQKQRFSIAVGLVNDPKVLFLDEPTTGLDPQARRNLWDLVLKIRETGKTVVLTTHYMDEAEVLCDRIAVMDHSKIIALDTTQNLINSIGMDATVEFQSNHSIDPAILKDVSGAQTVVSDNGIYRITTSQPQQTLDGLFALSRREGFNIDQLAMKRATLEDVFLRLTGHQLRD